MLIAVGAIAILSVWKWGWNIEVLDYGRADQTYFDVKQAKAGETIHLCFDHVTWNRICPSLLVQSVVCQHPDPASPSRMISTRIDLDPHVIDAPPKSGPIGPKCRRFVVPQECGPGPLTFRAFAQSECPPFWSLNPRYAYPPDIKLNIVP